MSAPDLLRASMERLTEPETGPAMARRWLLVWFVCTAAFMLAPFRFEYLGPRKVNTGLGPLKSGGVRFDGPSVLRTSTPPVWLDSALAAQELDLLLEVRSASAQQGGPARIVTLSNGSLERNFMIGQKGPDLVVRARREGSDRNGMPPLKVDGVFAGPGEIRLEVRFRPDVIEVFVNGEARYREKVASSPFERWDPSYRLGLGDEVNGARGWDGDLRLATATVAGTTHDLLLEPTLERPDTFWEIPEQTRRLWRVDPSYAFLVEPFHLLLFVPLGALLCLAWRRFNTGMLGRAALLGLGIGAAFQLIKVCFPGRHPSLIHAPFNAIGSALGVWLASRLPFQSGGTALSRETAP